MNIPFQPFERRPKGIMNRFKPDPAVSPAKRREILGKLRKRIHEENRPPGDSKKLKK